MTFDAIVVGGSFAGLTAATYIARARRSVCVIDAGAPRNRFAAHSHGVFAQDGSRPADMLAAARAQVAAYPTVHFVSGRATDASRTSVGFRVTLGSGDVLDGRKLVLAFGITDELPEIPGLRERWGSSVLHCPYCHGYEVSGRRLGVLDVSPMSIHQATLIAEWGPTTFYVNGRRDPESEELRELRDRGLSIESGRVVALLGDAVSLTAVELDDGRMSAVDALFLGPPTRLNSPIAERLGCAIDEGPFGPVIRTDLQKETTVPGVFAAGDITRPAHTVTWAMADGVTAGVAVHRSLVFGPATPPPVRAA